MVGEEARGGGDEGGGVVGRSSGGGKRKHGGVGPAEDYHGSTITNYLYVLLASVPANSETEYDS